MKKLGAVVLGLSLLVGCSSEEATTEVQEPKEQSTEVTETVEQTEKEEPKQDKESKAQAYAEYADKILPIVTDMSTIMGANSELATMAGEDPSLFYDSYYLETVEMSSEKTREVTARLRAVEVPDHPKLKEAHELLLKSADELDFIADTFPEAVRNVDPNLFSQCADSARRISDYMIQANTIVQEALSEIQ